MAGYRIGSAMDGGGAFNVDESCELEGMIDQHGAGPNDDITGDGFLAGALPRVRATRAI